MLEKVERQLWCQMMVSKVMRVRHLLAVQGEREQHAVNETVIETVHLQAQEQRL